MPIQRWGHFLPLAVTIVSKRWIIVSFSWTLVSNVNTEEVEGISLDDLHGVEEVIRQLEIDMIVPFERDGLSQKLCLRPRRGVLLYGPPGTGKTTIGRALAHRLRSKFFLLDGTVISGTQQFSVTGGKGTGEPGRSNRGHDRSRPAPHRGRCAQPVRLRCGERAGIITSRRLFRKGHSATGKTSGTAGVSTGIYGGVPGASTKGLVKPAF